MNGDYDSNIENALKEGQVTPEELNALQTAKSQIVKPAETPETKRYDAPKQPGQQGYFAQAMEKVKGAYQKLVENLTPRGSDGSNLEESVENFTFPAAIQIDRQTVNAEYRRHQTYLNELLDGKIENRVVNEKGNFGPICRLDNPEGAYMKGLLVEQAYRDLLVVAQCQEFEKKVKKSVS